MWCSIIRPHLYRRVALKTQAHRDTFLSAVRRSSILGSTVRVLSVDLHPFRWGDTCFLTLNDLPWILARLPLLYELRLDLLQLGGVSLLCAMRNLNMANTFQDYMTSAPSRSQDRTTRPSDTTLRSLPSPPITALRISCHGSQLPPDYYRLLSVWSSVQFLYLQDCATSESTSRILVEQS